MKASITPPGEELNRLSGEAIAGAIEVHRALGPGLLESVYEAALMHELVLRGLHVERQAALPVEYKGVKLDDGFRIDLWVERGLVLEIKAVEKLLPVHEAQLQTYLRLAECRLGLLINFNVPLLKSGIRRIVL